METQIKVKKKFNYNGIELRIVERNEQYSSRIMKMTRVLAPNNGVIPVRIESKQTLKRIIAETIKALDNFKSMGVDVIKELTRNNVSMIA